MTQADSVYSTPPTNTPVSRRDQPTSAPGASSLCPASVIPASQFGACQAIQTPPEPAAADETCTSRAGRSINRRTAIMNMLVSTAIAGAAVATVAECAAAAVQPDDSTLLELEERIFEHH